MTITVYRDLDGDWRWTMTAPNGKTVADSSEGYRRRCDCVRMANRIAHEAIFRVEVPA